MSPRYVVIPCIKPRVRYIVRDTLSGQFCATPAEGESRAQAELYAERLNASAEIAEHRVNMERAS